jgi:hypothetical protein
MSFCGLWLQLPVKARGGRVCNQQHSKSFFEKAWLKAFLFHFFCWKTAKQLEWAVWMDLSWNNRYRNLWAPNIIKTTNYFTINHSSSIKSSSFSPLQLLDNCKLQIYANSSHEYHLNWTKFRHRHDSRELLSPVSKHPGLIKAADAGKCVNISIHFQRKNSDPKRKECK